MHRKLFLSVAMSCALILRRKLPLETGEPGKRRGITFPFRSGRSSNA